MTDWQRLATVPISCGARKGIFLVPSCTFPRRLLCHLDAVSIPDATATAAAAALPGPAVAAAAPFACCNLGGVVQDPPSVAQPAAGACTEKVTVAVALAMVTPSTVSGGHQTL